MTRFFGITIVQYTESKKIGNSNKKNPSFCEQQSQRAKGDSQNRLRLHITFNNNYIT
jgi:hypothetical protein